MPKNMYTHFFFIFMYVPCILCIVFFNSTNNTLYIYIYTFLTIIQTKKQRNTFHTRPVNLTQIKLSPEQINTLDIGFDYAKEKHSSSQLHKMYHSRRTAKISWWWAERLPETCTVVIPIKLDFSSSVCWFYSQSKTQYLARSYIHCCRGKAVIHIPSTCL